MPEQVFEARAAFDATPEELHAWHEREGAFERLTPPWERVDVLEREGGLADARVVLRVRQGPVPLRWVARHTSRLAPHGFADEQVRGPFRRWRHEHRFAPLPGGRAEMIDRITYELPGGAAGSLLADAMVRRRLTSMMSYRHERLSRDLSRHRSLAPRRVAITGATGRIGTHLTSFLTTGGHRAHRLVRHPPRLADDIAWNPSRGSLDPAALEGVLAVVHLAGENISGGRWSAKRKERILRSRVEGTSLVASTLAAMRHPPEVLVSASAVGIYGDRGDEVLDADSALGEGFLADVCRQWEEATKPAADAGIRVVNMRTGLVLSARGGALARLLPPFLAGVGGRVGHGRQWWSWIDVDDVVGAIHHAIATPSLSGAVEVVAPGAVRSEEFTRTLSRVLGRPHVFPLPAAALRAAFGEMADAVLLASQRVVPKRLSASGYAFAHETLESSLREQTGRLAPSPRAMEVVS